MRRIRAIFWLLAVMVIFVSGAPPAGAVEVKISFVPHDAPDETVAARTRREPVMKPVSTESGVQMKQVGLDLVSWARNVRLDGKPLFERYHKGKYLGRKPVAKVDLEPGEHVVTPGNHAFTVKENGSLATDAAGLRAGDGHLRILGVPVTLRAFRANPPSPDLPIAMRVAPLPNMTLRDATRGKGDAERGAARELVPVFTKFAPLTLYLPLHETGKGYVVHPMGLTFRLTPKGVELGAGDGTRVPGVRAEGTRIDVPLNAFPVRGKPGTRLVVAGQESVSFEPGDKSAKRVRLYPRTRPYVLRFAKKGPTIEIPGKLGSLPVKAFALDGGARTEPGQRAVAAEVARRRLRPGGRVAARIRAVDVSPAVKARRALNEAKAKAKRLRKREAKAKKALAGAEKAVAKAKKALERKNAVGKKAQKRLEKARTALEKTRKAIESAKARAEKARKRLEAEQQSLEKAQAERAERAKAVKKAEQALAEAKKALAAARAARKRAEKRLAEAKKNEAGDGKKKKKNGNGGGSGKKSGDGKGGEKNENGEKKDGSAQNGGEGDAGGSKKEKRDDEGDDVAAARKALERAKKREAKAEKAVSEAKKRLESARAALAEQKTRIESLAEAVEAAQQALERARSEAKGGDKRIAERRAAVKEARKAVEAAKKAVASARKKLERARAEAEKKQSALEAARKKRKSAEEAVKARKKAYERAAQRNPLADAAPVARLVPYGDGEAHALSIERGEGDRLQLGVPKVASGVYRLELGVEKGGALTARCWVSVAEKVPFALGTFTPRGRTAFERGERFWIGVAAVPSQAKVPAGRVSLSLKGPRGATLPLWAGKAEGGDRDESWIVELPPSLTRRLAPGDYRVVARLGDRAARGRRITLVEPRPKTHFTNIQIAKFSAYEEHYKAALRQPSGANELMRHVRRSGLNAFCGFGPMSGRIHYPRRRIEQVARRTAALGPWEGYRQPSGRARVLDAAVRHRVRFYEELFTYNDTTLPKHPGVVDASARFSALEAASMRYSPAFAGASLYSLMYQRSLIDPKAVISAYGQATEASFRRRHDGLTSSEAQSALNRFIRVPPGRRDKKDLRLFRKWPNHRDWQWRRFHRRMDDAIKAAAPGAETFALQNSSGTNAKMLDTATEPRNVAGPLDVAVSQTYKDGGRGDFAVYGAIRADIMSNVPGTPVWAQMHSWGSVGRYTHHNLREAFLALTQDPEGFTYYSMRIDPHIAPLGTGEGGSRFDFRDTFRSLSALTTPYGDFFRAVEPAYNRVAVYYSDAAHQLETKKDKKYTAAVEGLWVACMRAGYAPDLITDPQVRAGEAQQYDVLFAPGFTIEGEVPKGILEGLRSAVQAGTVVAGERGTVLPEHIEAVKRLDAPLDEFDPKANIPGQTTDMDFRAIFERSDKTTELVRSFLEDRTKPAAEHDLLLGPDWLAHGKGSYLAIANFSELKLRGLHHTLYQRPRVAELRFPARPEHVYDVLEHERVSVEKDGEWMRLEADMRAYPGKIYAFLPTPVNRVRVRHPKKLGAGERLRYRAAVLGPDGEPIDAAFPLEITIRGPGGEQLLHVYRAATPRFKGDYTIPANARTGTWTLTVRELIHNRRAKAKFRVTKGELPKAELAKRDVWGGDEKKRIRKFLQGEEPILIPVGESQDWVRSHAKRAARALEKRGRKARVVTTEAVVSPPDPWNRKDPALGGTRLWRGEVVKPGMFVDGPVLLLGGRYENRLIEGLIRRGAIAPALTAHFPSRGKAIVSHTPLAFSTDHDAVAVLAGDEAGLEKGLDRVLAMAKGAGASSGESAQAAGDEGPSGGDAGAVEGPAPEATTASTQPAAEANDFGGTISGGQVVRAIDRAPDGGRVVVGTSGFGDNLFCFEADGSLAWKTFLPEHNVYFARWIDGGERIVAATARGYHVFLIKADSGEVIQKFASTEWPRGFGHGGQWEGAIRTEVPIRVNPALEQILIAGRTGVLAVSYDGEKMWFYDRIDAITRYDRDVITPGPPDFPTRARVGELTLSPDGKRIAYGEYRAVGTTKQRKEYTAIWAYRPRILDAETGEVLAVNRADPGNQTAPKGWRLTWPDGSDHPWIHTEGLRAPFRLDGTRGPFEVAPGRPLRQGGFLARSPRGLRRVGPDGKTQWMRRAGPREWLTELSAIGPKGKTLYRCDWNGRVEALDLASGETMWHEPLGYSAALEPAPGGGVWAGTEHGRLVRLGPDGKTRWRRRLDAIATVPKDDYNAFLARARRRDPDVSERMYPVSRDRPGDYEGVLRRGRERIRNGDFENDGAWKLAGGKAAPTLDTAAARRGKRSLALDAGERAIQPIRGKAIASATYLLEFFYRTEKPGAGVVAGVALDGAHERQITGSRFDDAPPGEWRFGRLAVKTWAKTKSLTAGFEAVGGAVRVDRVSLTPIRFPSANLLASPQLHKIEPTYVSDPRVRYNPLPRKLANKLRRQNRVVAFQYSAQESPRFYQEDAFLHNGRLDDVGPRWTFAPNSIGFNVTLAKPAHVSHVVLYLNHAMPDRAYRFVAILAQDLEKNVLRKVDLVRNNERRFVVAHFDEPVRTDMLKILPGKHPPHKQAITEIEVYGPVGGLADAETDAAGDPSDIPMLMDTPRHVVETLPADLTGSFEALRPAGIGRSPAFHNGATFANGRYTAGRARGAIFRYKRAGGRVRKAGQWDVGSVPALGTPARYAGRLITGCADRRVRAVADGGSTLWSFKTGGRVYSSPTPKGHNVYVGSDDGKLYKLDIDSGMRIWSFETGGRIRGGPALAGGRVYAPSWDGRLYAVDAQGGGLVWKSRIAPHTRSSPAVADGRVYIGDEKGVARCFDANSGSLIWKRVLEGRFSHCPVVTERGVVFVADDGTVFALGRDGSQRWRTELGARVLGQSMPTQTQLVVPTADGPRVLRRSDGKADPRFDPPDGEPRVIAAIPQNGTLWMTSAKGTVQDVKKSGGRVIQTNETGRVRLWVPAKEKEAK